MSDKLTPSDLMDIAQLLDDCLMRIYPEEFSPEAKEAAAKRFFAGRGTIARIASTADRLRVIAGEAPPTPS